MLDKADYSEALEYQRAAVEATPSSHPNYPIYASNLGRLIADAVQAGVLDVSLGAVEMSTLVEGFWDSVRWAASSLQQRRAVLEASRALTRVAPEIILLGVGPGDAVRAIECLRNHLLGGLRSPQLPDDANIPDEAVQRYRAAASRYEQAQVLSREQLADAHDTAAALKNLTDTLETVRVLPGLDWFGRGPRVSDLASQIGGDWIGVYLLGGQKKGAAILLDQHGKTRWLELPGLSLGNAAANVSALLGNRFNAAKVTAWLWEVLAPLLADAECRRHEWLLIPTGILGMLPWHAAGDGHTTLDEHIRMRIVPSLKRGSVPTRTATGTPLVGVVDANELTFLDADLAIGKHFLPTSTPILKDQMTRNAVLIGLAEAPFAMLSGHASHDLRDGGGLVLSDGMLTSALVERLPPRVRDVAILSSCSSAQIAADLPDEWIGLPSALIAAGFRGVHASMWPVGDLMAFITIARIFETHRDNPDLPPDLQLRQVRTWLRTATASTLRTWFTTLVNQVVVPPAARTIFNDWLGYYTDTETPLADPAHWLSLIHI